MNLFMMDLLLRGVGHCGNETALAK